MYKMYLAKNFACSQSNEDDRKQKKIKNLLAKKKWLITSNLVPLFVNYFHDKR